MALDNGMSLDLTEVLKQDAQLTSPLPDNLVTSPMAQDQDIAQQPTVLLNLDQRAKSTLVNGGSTVAGQQQKGVKKMNKNS